MDKLLKFNLFPRKEMYITEHTATGSSTYVASIPKRLKRKMIHENMHLMDGMRFTPQNQFPQLEAYNGPTNFTCIPYNQRNKFDGKNQAVHFFLNDYMFRDAVWCNLEYTTYAIRHFDYYFTPDLSLWKDLPTEFYNKENVYRTRFVGAYWQKCGYNVIPTASWGNLNSFSYCFEGLPEYSVTGVSGMGNRKNTAAYNLWCYGLRRLEEAKSPTLIMVYGQEIDIPGLNTPVKFIPDFISTRLRTLKDENK